MGIRWGGARGFLIAAGLVSSLVAVGCGGSAHASAAEQSEAVARAASNTSAASGMKMDISLNETLGGGPSVAFTASGSFTPRTRSASLLMNMRVPAAGGPSAPMRVVITNGTIYERLPSQLSSQIPGGRPWLSLRVGQLSMLGQLPGLNSFIRETLIFDDPQQYLTLLGAAASGSAKEVGQAEVNGRETTQYQTAISVSKLPTATPSAARLAAQQLTSVLQSRFHTSAMPVDVWIDQAHLIRRLEATVTGSFQGQVVSIAITENILHYGPQAAPMTPLASNTTDLLSLVEGLPLSAG